MERLDCSVCLDTLELDVVLANKALEVQKVPLEMLARWDGWESLVGA